MFCVFCTSDARMHETFLLGGQGGTLEDRRACRRPSAPRAPASGSRSSCTTNCSSSATSCGTSTPLEPGCFFLAFPPPPPQEVAEWFADAPRWLSRQGSLCRTLYFNSEQALQALQARACIKALNCCGGGWAGTSTHQHHSELARLWGLGLGCLSNKESAQIFFYGTLGSSFFFSPTSAI